MLEEIKAKLKELNKKYDEIAEPTQLYYALGMIFPGILMTASTSGFWVFAGVVYFAALFAVRWAYLKDMF